VARRRFLRVPFRQPLASQPRSGGRLYRSTELHARNGALDVPPDENQGRHRRLLLSVLHASKRMRALRLPLHSPPAGASASPLRPLRPPASSSARSVHRLLLSPRLSPALCCSSGAGGDQAQPHSQPTDQRSRSRWLVFRRGLLCALLAKVVLFTPSPQLASSLLLGAFASLLASKPALLAMLPLGAHLSSQHKAAVGVAVYLLAGLCEIGGGWLVWQALRTGKPWWWALCGSVVLVAYGFVASMQPVADFGRAFALYGGYFIILSIAWAAALDGFRPDKGDFVGCALVLAGIVVMSAWPRPPAPAG